MTIKRRDFLKKSVAGAASFSLFASGLLSTSCKSTNDRVVLALIGAGNRGLRTIISTCQNNTDVEIKTVCDVNDIRAEKAVNEIEKKLGYKPRTTRKMKELFDDKDIDAVWIATPDHWHALATIWACQAGKDVYVETGPNISIREGKKMIEAAARYRRIIQAGYQNRSASYNLSARDYIQSGNLGQVVHIRIYNLSGGSKWIPEPDEQTPGYMDWDTWLGPASYRPYNPGIYSNWGNYWAYGAGTLSRASHQLDLARMIMGDPEHPKSVYGWGGNHVWGSGRETPESQSITFDFDKFTITCDSGNTTNYMSETPVDICMDYNKFPEWKTNSDRIEIYGTLGLMFLGKNGGGWQVFGPKEEIIAQEGGIHPDIEHQVNFIESIRTRKQPNSNIAQAHQSAALHHLSNIAYRSGNKQLLFDGSNEQFIENDNANKLLRVSYRDNYNIPENV